MKLRSQRFRLGKNLTDQWDNDAELDLLRHYCRQDFWSFFLYAFGAALNPRARRWVDPEIHKPMAEWFQHHIDEWFKDRENGVGKKKHLAVLVHRRVGKTTMFTRAGQLWLHLRDPEMSTYTGAESMLLSTKMLAAMKAVLDGSDPHAMFTKMYGDWAGNARMWATREIVHSARRNTSRQDPSMGAFAVETSITGGHPDAIFYDDPVSYERLDSDTNWLEAVQSQVSSLFPAIESDALVVWVGTRYDDADHFGTAFRDEGVATVSGMMDDSIPLDPNGKWHVYFLAGRDKQGKATTPKIWSDTEMERYKKLDPTRYAAQVLNDPSESETNPITAEQLRQCIIPAKEVPWSALRFAITCDTAFARAIYRPGKDWSVFIVHGYTRNGSGDVYVCECHGSPHWRAEDFGHRLVSLCQRYRNQGRRIFAIGDEEETGGKPDSWKISLRNMFHDASEPMPMYYQWNRYSGTKKVARLEAASTFWVDGHVRVVEGAPGVDMLMKQMMLIGALRLNPKRGHDDFVDAHSDAFQPELYQPMRRMANQVAPYARGAMAIDVDGIDSRMFEDDEFRTWQRDNPREPLR